MNDNNTECNDPASFNTLSIEKQEHLLNWIATRIVPIKSFNLLNSSYGLKHIYEGEFHNEDRYLTNGEFKGAMLKAGYNVKNQDDKNWNFNISKRSPIYCSKKP